MAESTDKVIRQLRQVLGLDDGCLADAELLGRYVQQRDAEAFEALVRRHGSLVWGVCHRILGSSDDADDAFQATFLVFARKAATIRKGNSVGGWLHGVARQIARQSQAQSMARRRRERRGQAMEGQCPMNASPVQAASLRELAIVVDDELAKLPADCRAALAACYLEGQTAAAAARHMGIPASTLKTRLERGTELLRQRLSRRGIELSGLALTVVLGEQARISAAHCLVDATAKAALAFAASGTAIVSARVFTLAGNSLRAMAIAKATTGFLAASMLGLLGVLGAAMAIPKAADPGSPPPDDPASIEVATPDEGIDRHGDPLPSGAIARLGTIRWRHDRAVAFAEFLPDGKRVITVGDDLTIRVWEYPTGKEIHRIDLRVLKSTSLSADHHLSYVSAAALSPDGKTIATCMSWNEIRLHDVDSGRELPIIPGPEGFGRFVSMSFSADGRRLATADGAGTATIWDVPKRKALASSKYAEAEPNSPRINKVVLSPNGKTYALFEDGPKGTGREKERLSLLMLRNAETGAAIGSADHGHEAQFHSLVFSHDSKMLAFSLHGFRNRADNGDIVFVDFATGKEVRRIRHPKLAGDDDQSVEFSRLAFNKDGTKLYGHGRWWGTVVKEWEVASGQLLRVLGASRNAQAQFASGLIERYIENSMAFSPDGQTLVLAGANYLPNFLDIASGNELIPAIAHSSPIVSLHYSPDGKHILSRDFVPTVRQWDLVGRGVGWRDLPQKADQIVHAPGGRVVAARLWNKDNKFRLLPEFTFFDVATGAQLGKVVAEEFDHYLQPATFSGDAKRIVIQKPQRKQTNIYEVPSGKLLNSFNASKGRESDGRNVHVYVMVASPDGKLMATYHNPNVANLWDLTTASLRGTLTFPDRGPKKKNLNPDWVERPIPKGAFSPDSRCLAVPLQDGAIALFELAAGQVRRSLGNGISRPRSSKEKFGGSHTGSIYILKEDGPNVAVSPDRRLLAHAGPDQLVHLWDVVAGVELTAFRGHTGAINAVAFAPDGKSVASGGSDTTALVWDVTPWLVRRAAGAVSPDELATLWDQLAGNDAVKAFDAIVALSASPGNVVPFLSEKIKPAAHIAPERINRLIADLDSADFKVRDKANSDLLDIADIAAPALEKALANSPALETRRRLEALLDKSGATSMILHGERLRTHRVIEVLERIGTPEARRLLMSFANGAPGALLTRAAANAMER